MAKIDYDTASTNLETAVSIILAIQSLMTDLTHCFMGAGVHSEYLLIRVQDIQHCVNMISNVMEHDPTLHSKLKLTVFSRNHNAGLERKGDNGEETH